MNEQRKCLVGHDDDYGWAIGLLKPAQLNIKRIT